MTSSESEEHAPRKRTRTSNSAEDGSSGGKKARGRPRVDTQDATAADRRRTQIRLAQRAYRQRKETTIASLKNQSSQLHSIIEQMNKTFGRLNESALKSGLLQLNPELARKFKHVTETFCGLVKTASEGQYDGDEEQADAVDNAAEGHEERPRRTATETVSQPVGWGYSVPVASSQPNSLQQPHSSNFFAHVSNTFGQDVTTSSLVRHRQSTIGDILDQRNVSLPQQQSIISSSHSQQLPFGLLDLLSQQQASFQPSSSSPHLYSITVPTANGSPPIMRSATPPSQLSPSSSTPSGIRTYSFEETSFGRRLTRRSLEVGFQLLSTVNARPAALNRVFRLSLPFLTPDQIRTRFKLMLARGPDEDLDWWETPFIQVGGAGTHYPKRDDAGRIILHKNAWRIRLPGPLAEKVAQLEHVVDGRIESLDGVDLSGFEGEWFDAHDVQGYLEDKYACKLNPGSSFAECLVDDDDDDNSNNNKSAPDQNALPPHFGIETRRASHENGGPGLTNSSTNSSTSSASSSSANPPLHANSHDIRGTGNFGLDVNFTHEPTPTYRGGDIEKLGDYDISFDQTLGLDLAPGFDYGFSTDNGMDMSPTDLRIDVMHDNMASLPLVRQKRKKVITVDVSRLIDEIIKRGVCLGRSPGFRRKDVDVAVRTAAISTY
ncbi:hypothetical protein T440DRAFT_312119 [Plenodomus tracheiphilus IPT5]|uniref:BZIP domain-containing protein n=1 Tax=Plenodomus tracheiphilus IPT5 TaxID=1408161 RepID=A0A6A7BE47_9PLEO|nr:hypothetical protein T440DRAFT_312119 [Plenodomus tracheiphilus IPT5]